MSRRLFFLAPLLLVAFLATACEPRPMPDDRTPEDRTPEDRSPPTSLPDPRTHPPAGEAPSPTRGLVLISVDTLRADHLGAYGYHRDTSPRFDELAARGVLFERAYVQAPSTLISHMSIFTSLFPPQHGVKPPAHNVLATEIPTFPEHLRAAGLRTAGHTEGGYMEGDHGFARGFDEWSDPGFRDSTDVESTLEKGLDFLRGVGPEERFFLFLHTYSVHDPYAPPAPHQGRFWDGEPPLDAPASAATLEAINEGRLDAGAEEAAYFAARYDDGIRYADEVLGRFVGAVEELGLLDEITLVITSDHGEEFLEHGRMLHVQVYDELLHVPLLVLHPDLAPRRVPAPVRSVDLAPTLLELAEAEPLPDVAGRSLLPLLAGREAAELYAPIYAEVAFEQVQRTLLEEVGGRLWQVVESAPLVDPDGAWIARSVVADVEGPRMGLRATSFHRPRMLRVERLGPPLGPPLGAPETLLEEELDPTWRELEVALPDRGGDRRGRHRIRLSVESCDTPESLGMGADPRCLGFMVAQPPLLRRELFDLGIPWEESPSTGDFSFRHPALLDRLSARLRALQWQTRAAAGQRSVGEEERRALEALGYL